jgi:hypothetical protein
LGVHPFATLIMALRLVEGKSPAFRARASPQARRPPCNQSRNRIAIKNPVCIGVAHDVCSLAPHENCAELFGI